MNSAGSGLKGAVACTAFIAALSAPGSPEDLNTLQDSNLPSFAILKSSTTRLLSLPFGGSQFILIRLCNSLIYGPKSGSLIASIPGLPFGFPGPGFPYPPVPPPPPLASLLPEPPVGANDGAGAYLPLPDEVLPPPPPALADVPEPLIGPVEYLPLPVPPLGTGTVNADDGFAVGLGVVGGFNDGHAVGGAGLAA